MTTAEAAASRKLSVGTFLLRAGKFRPKATIKTGKRGRPAIDWSEADVARVK